MHDNQAVLTRFFSAFAQVDPDTMASGLRKYLATRAAATQPNT